MAKKPDETVAIINEVFDALYEDLTDHTPSSVINAGGERISLYTAEDIQSCLGMLNQRYRTQGENGAPIGDWA